ncbi:MAG: hypothetical protein K1X75_09885 [Leptospirales bacterium]|nr:hypothetical protein [Leptospirales bacterium]
MSAELSKLGARSVRSGRRAVRFRADRRLLYQAHLQLRTAVRILKPVASFQARSDTGLYRGIFEADLSEWLPPKRTFLIENSVHSRIFRHSGFAALKAKDAIVDRQRQDHGQRSSIHLKKPDIRLHLHIDEDQVDLSLDASGEPLHHRLYRLDHGQASLNECLAAGLVALSGWRSEDAFVDPMCGAGTLAIEAAMKSLGIAPGHKRSFAFERWPDFDARIMQELRAAAQDQAAAAERRQPTRPIIAADNDAESLRLARSNAARAHVAHAIDFQLCDARKLRPPPPPGIVLTNPPYGERLKPADLAALYTDFGNALRQNFGGYRAWIFSANRDGLGSIALERGQSLRLKNGALDCEFCEFVPAQGTDPDSRFSS